MSKPSELSNDQKSRWLADRIEPAGCPVCWRTRNFVNDPAMTMMLIERMPYVCIYRINGIWRIWPNKMIYASVYDNEPIEHKHLGTAVVDASMLQMDGLEGGVMNDYLTDPLADAEIERLEAVCREKDERITDFEKGYWGSHPHEPQRRLIEKEKRNAELEATVKRLTRELTEAKAEIHSACQALQDEQNENQKMAELLDQAPHERFCDDAGTGECDCWKKEADALLSRESPKS